MAQFTDLEFTAREDGQGFETCHTFENFWQMHVVCGEACFTDETVDAAGHASADLYTKFEYKVYDGVNAVADEGNWVGNQSQAQITAKMQEVAGNAAVFVPPVAEE